jgi:hypothetical protein
MWRRFRKVILNLLLVITLAVSSLIVTSSWAFEEIRPSVLRWRMFHFKDIVELRLAGETLRSFWLIRSSISSVPVFPIFRSFQLFAYCSGQCWGSGSVCFLFLGLQHPDPLLLFVRIRILPSSSKKSRETLFTTVLWLIYVVLSLKTDINVFKKIKRIN